jgi:S-adenosylmethionine synthetase
LEREQIWSLFFVYFVEFEKIIFTTFSIIKCGWKTKLRENVMRLFTSESVTEGHPDKICDQIADNVLDAILTNDKYARVACEAMVLPGSVIVAGEITTNCYVDIARVARETIKRIGYADGKYDFDYRSCGVLIAIDEQSREIADAVDKSLESRAENVEIGRAHV